MSSGARPVVVGVVASVAVLVVPVVRADAVASVDAMGAMVG